MPLFERLWGTIVALLTHRNNKKTAKRAESAICRFDGRQATFAFHRRSACWNTAGIKNSPFITRPRAFMRGPVASSPAAVARYILRRSEERRLGKEGGRTVRFRGGT